MAARSSLAQLIDVEPAVAADWLNHVQCSIFQNAPKLRRAAANVNAVASLAELSFAKFFELIILDKFYSR